MVAVTVWAAAVTSTLVGVKLKLLTAGRVVSVWAIAICTPANTSTRVAKKWDREE